MKTNRFYDFSYWWLEEMPLAELSSEEAQDIVTAYRAGDLGFEEALDKLERECQEEFEAWAKINSELSEIFSLDEEEDPED